MIEIPFLTAEIVFAVIWFLYRLIACLKRRHFSWKRELIFFLIYLNLAIILRIAFFPRELVNGRVQPLVFNPATMFPLNINFKPFEKLFVYASKTNMLVNNLGNFAVFVPTGIFLPMAYGRLNRFWKVVGIGALMSLGIEILQLPFSSRITDVDDLILNTLGVAAGYVLFLLIRKIYWLLRRAHVI